ncbi:MAG: Uma2 family endonuclease [Chloroflexi bacterium]|nr:Uma2 family endonuclease [Chloroflexota bacterium]
MPVSEKTYLKLALEDPDSNWELHRGELRSKTGMTAEHGDLSAELGFMIRGQIDRQDYRVRINHGRIRRSARRFYIPDVMVMPATVEQAQRGRPHRAEVYSEPIPFVAEVWSPSTGAVDAKEKLPEYRRRGDLEIWFLHPYNRTLTTWVRQSDGTYTESTYTGGVVRISSLPNVTVDLDALFADQ